MTIAGQTFTVNQAAGSKKVFDFDGDGKADVAVFRPSTGLWYINNFSNGTTTVVAWGTSGDVPVATDYDGDGKTDVGVRRPKVISKKSSFLAKSRNTCAAGLAKMFWQVIRTIYRSTQMLVIQANALTKGR